MHSSKKKDLNFRDEKIKLNFLDLKKIILNALIIFWYKNMYICILLYQLQITMLCKIKNSLF